MPLTRDDLRRLAAVAHARGLGFVELVGLAELDPATAFRGAVIRGADLRGQDLAGFDFSGAALMGTDLTGANLSRAKGVTAKMLDGTIHDRATRFPPRLRAAFWSGAHPAWAEDWGRDRHGKWVSFRIPGTAVTQRMRWIPPGRFTMGSPEREPGRFDDEGPRHAVTIAAGFWLFDTPCTQALWEAVMGDNPSEFKSPDRPVETVSFQDAHRFLAQVNARVPGLDLTLPAEARWEYACRAGTKTATYAGPIEILGDNNAPVLDPIAWYGGNSGVDFELDDGDDSSGWPGKQYEHTKAGTHPARRKEPNAWGLYDMLGNVWEWCEDHWHGDYTGAPTNGSVWLDADSVPDSARGAADRVLRGGSWYVGARLARAACRNRLAPADRGGFIGFRCARVQNSEQANRSEGQGGASASEWSEPAATTSP